MKIVCDTCGTRYSIDDRRVAGRSVKIRCKQCAHIIVLPGPRAPTAEPAVPGTWHAVIDGIPRPIATEDLRQLRAAGVLDDRALVWREGFEDWRELGSVDELREAGRPSVEVAPDAGPEGKQADELDARTGAGTDGAGGRSPEPAPLRGVRHENSVLFSLGNLARIAAPTSAAASPLDARTEGSGLLDIRSLARTRAPARSERGPVAEVPVFGALAFGEPAVLFPRPPRRDRRLIWALAATAGALAIATAILVVLMLRGAATARADTPAVRQAPPGTATPQPPPAAPASDPAASTAVTHAGPEAAPETAHAEASATQSATRSDGAAPSQATHAAPTATASPAEHAGTSARAAAASRRASTRTPSSSSAAAVASRSADAGAPLAVPAHPAEACSEITCIVNGYTDPCCVIYRRPAAGGAATRAELPDSLDRAAVTSGLGRIDTRRCGQQSPAHGDVKVSVKVSPAGAVTDVTVKSSPDPALDACVTAVVRKGAFSATQRGGSFAYVWRF